MSIKADRYSVDEKKHNLIALYHGLLHNIRECLLKIFTAMQVKKFSLTEGLRMLVNCVAYRDGHKLMDLQLNQIGDYIKRIDTFVWVGFKDPDEDEFAIIKSEFDIHHLAFEDIKKGHQRPKIEEYGDTLFTVLHTVELDDDGQLILGEVNILLGPNFILSVRNRSKKGFASVRQRCEREPMLLKNGSAFVLYVLMDTIVDRYFPVVDELQLQLEKVEERIFTKSSSTRLNIEELYVLKRKLMALQHATIPLLEAVSKLHGGRVPPLFQGMQEYFRDVDDHVLRITKSIETIREMVTTAIHVNFTLISLGESEVTKKLASYGALFAVPTAIAGIYGMNFKFMPELEWQLGYPLILLIIIIADILIWYRFRRLGWI